MKFIKGITFFPFAPKGSFEKEEVKKSLKIMKERTGADTVIFVPAGIQKNPQSTKIDWMGASTVSDEELCSMIQYAKELGLLTILKPTVNCENGVWRAFISFFDEDVPCEPKWSDWFYSYTQFQLHYAKIAEELQCEMFIPGCEMVMAESREKEWRQLIADIRKEYTGLVSYNTDKYQECNLKWWDCVDVISSSGYYPIDDMESQFERIKKITEQFKKPFFFAEVGCMSTRGSKYVPNDWELREPLDLDGQKEWYEKLSNMIKANSWIRGVGLWSWHGILPSVEEARENRFYEFYQKPAEEVVKEFFDNQL